jgi:hypothetical protein
MTGVYMLLQKKTCGTAFPDVYRLESLCYCRPPSTVCDPPSGNLKSPPYGGLPSAPCIR